MWWCFQVPFINHIFIRDCYVWAHSNVICILHFREEQATSLCKNKSDPQISLESSVFAVSSGKSQSEKLPECKQYSIEKYALNRKETNKIDKALAYFIATKMMPYSVVDKKGYRRFVKVLQPSYQLPSRKSLTEKMIPDKFLTTQATIKSELQKAEFFLFTTDAWTSVANKSYVSLTAHLL